MTTRLSRAPDAERVVAPLELFFDLVYVFAIAQVSHHLLEHVDLRTAAETAVLALASLHHAGRAHDKNDRHRRACLNAAPCGTDLAKIGKSRIGLIFRRHHRLLIVRRQEEGSGFTEGRCLRLGPSWTWDHGRD